MEQEKIVNDISKLPPEAQQQVADFRVQRTVLHPSAVTDNII